MALGTRHVRNWGREAQQIALDLLLRREGVAYRLQPLKRFARQRFALFLAPSRGGITLPFTESVADLVHVRRGRWEAWHPMDGRVLASGISVRDVVRATIKVVWQ